MKDNFLDRAKADGKVIVRTVNLVGKLGKLKIDIRSKKQDKERLLKEIGIKIFALARKNKFDGQLIVEEIKEELESAEQVDHDIAELEASVVQTKSDFKGGGHAPPADDAAV